jgi:hypothetical protein
MSLRGRSNNWADLPFGINIQRGKQRQNS